MAARARSPVPGGRGDESAGGEDVPYDYLVLATGAGMRPADVPGLQEHAETIWTPAEMSSLGRKLRELVDASADGRRRTILFLVPPNNKCAGPLYEIVLPFGLPMDERGFLRCEPGSRRVVGEDRIYAPGDAGDFPVKQAFLAFLQADAVAEDVAARVQGRAPGFSFDPVSMCVMEELDKATFAQARR